MKRIEPTFALRKKNASDPFGRVCAFINLTVKKGVSKTACIPMMDLTTGKTFKVLTSQWNTKKKCCIISGSKSEQTYLNSINSQIKEIQIAVRQIIQECEAQHTNITSALFSKENIYNRIKRIELFTEVPEKTKEDLLVSYWENFIQRAREGNVNHNGKPYKKATIVCYQKCLNSFYEFEKKQKHKYTFDEIDKRFYDLYVADMLQKGKMQNTIGEHIKNLKAVMNRAYGEGLHSNLVFQTFVKPEEEVDNVYLTEAELEQLFQYKFIGSNQMLEKYRDLFLVGCYTGLRWEDYKSIRKQDFSISSKGKPILVIRGEKTETKTIIPILWKHFKDLLEKYDYNLPKVSEQKFNKYIKMACLAAGINSPVVMTSGKYKRKEPYEKWELVASHTARRTACTNMFLKGIPTISIMKISGHKKESTFLKYIKISLEENADYIAEKYAEMD